MDNDNKLPITTQIANIWRSIGESSNSLRTDYTDIRAIKQRLDSIEKNMELLMKDNTEFTQHNETEMPSNVVGHLEKIDDPNSR